MPAGKATLSVSIPVEPPRPVTARALPLAALKAKYWLVPSKPAATARPPAMESTPETKTVLPSNKLVAFSPVSPVEVAGTATAALALA